MRLRLLSGVKCGGGLNAIADALFAAFEAERSTWIASMDAGDERREFEARVHAFACAMAATGAAWPPSGAIAAVRAIDAALVKERGA